MKKRIKQLAEEKGWSFDYYDLVIELTDVIDSKKKKGEISKLIKKEVDCLWSTCHKWTILKENCTPEEADYAKAKEKLINDISLVFEKRTEVFVGKFKIIFEEFILNEEVKSLIIQKDMEEFVNISDISIEKVVDTIYLKLKKRIYQYFNIETNLALLEREISCEDDYNYNELNSTIENIIEHKSKQIKNAILKKYADYLYQ